MARSIGVLHPGQMGSAVAAAVIAGGGEARWVSQGRSDETRARAAADRMIEVADLAALVSSVDAVVSLCPPGSARAVAESVVEAGFQGLYVDANAIAPSTAHGLADLVTGAGGSFVDGGVIGGPPRIAGTTWLHLSGDRADEVAGWFDGTVLSTVVHPGGPGLASAVKACFAAWTKGSAALIVSVLATARAHGVEQALLDQWSHGGSGLGDTARSAARSLSAKGWRWDGEMLEIARTFADGGLPAGFHEASAEVCTRLAGFRDQPAELDEVIAALLDPT